MSTTYDGQSTSKLLDTVAQIDQRVDERLESGLAEFQQRLEKEKDPTQSQQNISKGKEKAPFSSAEIKKKSWADIMSEENGEVSDEDLAPSRAKKPKLLKVSEETKKLVKESFTTTLSNSDRREMWGTAPALDLAQTKCPRLDALFKTEFTGNLGGKAI